MTSEVVAHRYVPMADSLKKLKANAWGTGAGLRRRSYRQNEALELRIWSAATLMFGASGYARVNPYANGRALRLAAGLIIY